VASTTGEATSFKPDGDMLACHMTSDSSILALMAQGEDRALTEFDLEGAVVRS